MENRRIGRLTNVSVVGLGCNNFGMRLDASATKTVVDSALDAGITYFDTAESYGDGRSEEFLGAALVGRRESALVATKWGHTVTLRDGDRGGDPAVIRRSLDVLDVCARDGIAFVPFFPLESGLLTGKYRAGEALPPGSRLANWGERSKAFIDDAKLVAVAGLDAWATERGYTLLELSMSWLTSNPLVATVIAGATSPTQVAANVAAAGWAMTDEDRRSVGAHHA